MPGNDQQHAYHGVEAKDEYNACFEMLKLFSSFRRQDMAFATTVQVALLAFLRDRILSLGFADLFLSVIGFFVLLMGLNNERRLSAYMRGYIRRAAEIEETSGMAVLKNGYAEVKNTKGLISNAYTFAAYYVLFALIWVVVWGINLSTKG